MAPFIDMTNHSPKANTSYAFETSQSGIVLKSDKAIEGKSDLSSCYSQGNHAEFYLEYGFFTSEDSKNFCLIPLAMHDEIEFLEEKK